MGILQYSIYNLAALFLLITRVTTFIKAKHKKQTDCLRNNRAKFENSRTILTCQINDKSYALRTERP